MPPQMNWSSGNVILVRTARIVHMLLAAVSLTLSATVASAAGPTPALSSYGESSVLSSLPRSVVVADFDADGAPDTVTADRSFGSRDSYHLEMQMSAAPDARLEVAGAQPTISIEAIDVDDDRDVDIVVIPILSRTAVSVFVNDGRGHFALGDDLSNSTASGKLAERAHWRTKGRIVALPVADSSAAPLLPAQRPTRASFPTGVANRPSSAPALSPLLESTITRGPPVRG
jgi:hypothetical protein